MLDRHDAKDGLNGHELPRREAAGENRPMADREVPPLARLTERRWPLHQWLDGDLAETDARRVDDKQVELWNRIATDTDRRRRMTTPVGLSDRIMAALPDATLDARLMTQTVVNTTAAATSVQGFSTTMVFAIGAGFFALGLLVGNMFPGLSAAPGRLTFG